MENRYNESPVDHIRQLAVEGYDTVTKTVNSLTSNFNLRIRSLFGGGEKLKNDVVNDLLRNFAYEDEDDFRSALRMEKIDRRFFNEIKDFARETYDNLPRDLYVHLFDKFPEWENEGVINGDVVVDAEGKEGLVPTESVVAESAKRGSMIVSQKDLDTPLEMESVSEVDSSQGIEELKGIMWSTQPLQDKLLQLGKGVYSMLGTDMTVEDFSAFVESHKKSPFYTFLKKFTDSFEEHVFNPYSKRIKELFAPYMTSSNGDELLIKQQADKNEFWTMFRKEFAINSGNYNEALTYLSRYNESFLEEGNVESALIGLFDFSDTNNALDQLKDVVDIMIKNGNSPVMEKVMMALWSKFDDKVTGDPEKEMGYASFILNLMVESPYKEYLKAHQAFGPALQIPAMALLSDFKKIRKSLSSEERYNKYLEVSGKLNIYLNVYASDLISKELADLGRMQNKLRDSGLKPTEGTAINVMASPEPTEGWKGFQASIGEGLDWVRYYASARPSLTYTGAALAALVVVGSTLAVGAGASSVMDHYEKVGNEKVVDNFGQENVEQERPTAAITEESKEEPIAPVIIAVSDDSTIEDADLEFTVEDTKEEVDTKVALTKSGLWGGVKDKFGFKTNVEFKAALKYMADDLRAHKGEDGVPKIGPYQKGWSALLANSTKIPGEDAYSIAPKILESLQSWGAEKPETKQTLMAAVKTIKKNKETVSFDSGVGKVTVNVSPKLQAEDVIDSVQSSNLGYNLSAPNYEALSVEEDSPNKFDFSAEDIDSDGWVTPEALKREIDKNSPNKFDFSAEDIDDDGWVTQEALKREVDKDKKKGSGPISFDGGTFKWIF